MPNIAAILKEEISRLARKETRAETKKLQKGSAQYRRDIAALKRQVAKLQRQVSLLESQVLTKPPAKDDDQAKTRVRFTTKGIRSLRKRLALSAADFGKLIGVAAQTVYNWEHEIARPRKKLLATLASVRAMGKKEAHARLKQLGKKTTKRRK